MEEIALACEAILDTINEFIYDKAFDKTRKLSKRIPFILIYCLTLLLLIALLVFIGVNLVLDNNWFGYLLLLLFSLLICFVLIYPFIFYKKRKK